jgi:hypothetical protein
MVRLRNRQKTPAPAAERTAPDVYPIDLPADDHGLHVTDESCARCGRPILPTDEARRTATGGCVHLTC